MASIDIGPVAPGLANGARLCRTPAAGIPVAGGPALPGGLLLQLQRVILLVTILILITGKCPRPQTQHHAALLHSPTGREQSAHGGGSGGGVDASGVSCQGGEPLPDVSFFSPLSSHSYYYPSPGRCSSPLTLGPRLPPARPRDFRASPAFLLILVAARHLHQCWAHSRCPLNAT